MNYINSSCTIFNQNCSNAPKYSDTSPPLPLRSLYTTDTLIIKVPQYLYIVYYQRSHQQNVSNSRFFFKITIVKINIIKIFIKNTYFITRKYDITRIFTKIEYIFICVLSSKTFFVILFVTNQSETNFNIARQSSADS